MARRDPSGRCPATAVGIEFRRHSTLLLVKGLVVFRSPVPARLGGQAPPDTDLRRETKSTVIALANGSGMRTDIDPDTVLPAGTDLVLIGDAKAEERFLRYSARRPSAWWRPRDRARS